MTLRTKHNEFNSTQINKWINKPRAVPVHSPARVFQLEDGIVIKVGDKIQFNGQAAKIPKGLVEIKELRVGVETHQVMAALEYNGDLFYYHICDFVGVYQKSNDIPEMADSSMGHNVVFSGATPEPEASFKAYGLAEITLGKYTYLLDSDDIENLHANFEQRGVLCRESK